jgi:DNA-binding FadR family transcriptional regulator
MSQAYDFDAVPPPANEDRAAATFRVPKTAELVADQIRRRIVRGELPEGSFLPPESQLLETIGVSRPTLREAFRILEAEMLITVARGSRTGARVHAPRADSVSRYAGFVLQSQGTMMSDIYQARIAIEPFSVRQLAAKPDPEKIARLREEIARLTQMVDETRFTDFMIGIAKFHHLIVELAGNRTLLLITNVLQDVVARYQIEHLKRRPREDEEQRASLLHGVRSFHKLVDLIEQGDGEKAARHWELHLRNANKAWLGPDNYDAPIDVLS